jgi:hypothetical protein
MMVESTGFFGRGTCGSRLEDEMLPRVFVAAVLIVVAMVLVKDGRVLRGLGLTGSCTVVAGAPDGAQSVQCKAGKLEGWPDLSGRGCSRAGARGGLEYWHCPAALVSSPAGV